MDASKNDILDELMGFNISKESYLSNDIANSSLQLTELVEGIMSNCENDKISNFDVFKDIVVSLEEKVRMLTENVMFLHKEAENKNNIINQLLSIIQNGINRTNTNTSDNISDSEYNINVSEYNEDVSIYNQSYQSESKYKSTPNNLFNRYAISQNNPREEFNDYITQSVSVCDKRNIPIKIVDYDDTLHVNSMEMFSSTQVNPTAIDATNTITTSSSDYEEDAWYKYSKKCEWEKHSLGMASKKIHKMGYNGKGLGKNEDGIVEAIQVYPPQKKRKIHRYESYYIFCRTPC